MKIGSFRRIFYTDYPSDQQSLIQKLSVTINNGFENLYNAFQNNIDLENNIACTIKTVSATVDATGTPNSTLSFSITTTGTITGISVLNATGTPPVSVTSVSASPTTVTNIAGIPSNLTSVNAGAMWFNTVTKQMQYYDGTNILTIVGSTISNTNTVYPLSTPIITYTQNAQLITITNIAGLPPNITFSLDLVAFA